MELVYKRPDSSSQNGIALPARPQRVLVPRFIGQSLTPVQCGSATGGWEDEWTDRPTGHTRAQKEDGRTDRDETNKATRWDKQTAGETDRRTDIDRERQKDRERYR